MSVASNRLASHIAHRGELIRRAPSERVLGLASEVCVRSAARQVGGLSRPLCSCPHLLLLNASSSATAVCYAMQHCSRRFFLYRDIPHQIRCTTEQFVLTGPLSLWHICTRCARFEAAHIRVPPQALCAR